MVISLRLAGFEPRDYISWCFGSGFPKALDVSKALEGVLGKQGGGFSSAGDDGRKSEFKQNLSKRSDYGYIWKPSTEEAKKWEGWKSQLKSAHEPICLARKPLSEKTIAENVLKWGTGALNVDGCRVETEEKLSFGSRRIGDGIKYGKCEPTTGGIQNPQGRFPSNIIHDGSDAIEQLFPESKGQQGDLIGHSKKIKSPNGIYSEMPPRHDALKRNDSGSAARFFKECRFEEEDFTDILKYCSKASKKDRNEGLTDMANSHPTIKPVSLMQYLCRLITPPGGTVLDPFMGSGSTGKAALRENFGFIGIEMGEEYFEIAKRRIKYEADKI